MTVDQQPGEGRHRPAEQADRPAARTTTRSSSRRARKRAAAAGARRRGASIMRKAPAHSMNADLHCHSAVSDGTLEPEALAARAKANGVELWALTDHDEIGGQQRARDAAARARPALPHRHRDLGHLRRHDRAHRRPRLRRRRRGAGGRPGRHPRRAASRAHARWATALAKVGIHGAYEGALKYVGNPELISRTHFARFLVETRRLRRHAGGVSPLPGRRQARLRAAPLGHAAATRCAGSATPAASP